MERFLWGHGDELTLKILDEIRISGKWLNLAAGDGRYMKELLKKVESITAAYINEKYLRTLMKRIPEGEKKSK